jgi:hypothetical protein
LLEKLSAGAAKSKSRAKSSPSLAGSVTLPYGPRSFTLAKLKKAIRAVANEAD